jgi:hypothetical protein
MNQKRGVFRIVEASISIILVAGVLFFLFAKTIPTISPNLDEDARNVLEEIANNATLRSVIVNTDIEDEAELSSSVSTLSLFVGSRVPTSYSYEIRICGVDAVCGKSEFTDSEVFAGERVIGSTLDSFSPKKVKLFIWIE